MISALERWFQTRELGTTISREITAGMVTFMTMAYIIFINPIILAGAGMPPDAAIAATCLGAALPTLLMGCWANYPFALASGMGLNAALAIQAAQPGMTWQIMMGVVIVEGGIITVLVLTRCREAIMHAIPRNLKLAISVGIGLLIALLGLQKMGLVTSGKGGALLAHGDLQSIPMLIAALGCVIIFSLEIHRIRGAILWGILLATLMAFMADWLMLTTTPLASVPEQVWALPDFSAFLAADIQGALQPALIGVVFAFLITDFFDTMGTVVGVGGQAGFFDAQGRMPRLKRVLLVDSLAAVWGGLCGASSVTTYIESAAGTSEGGRTGLVSLVVGFGFLLALFFSPLINMVPAIATAPALIVVGFLMMRMVRDMDLNAYDGGPPAFLTLILIPLTQSISFGIGVGFLTHVLLQVLAGKAHDLSPWLYGIAAIFLVSFIFT